MDQHVQAIYSKGVLKPLTPLDLKDEELVHLTVSSGVDDTSEGEMTEDRFEELLLEKGLLSRLPPPVTDFTPYQNREPVKMDGPSLSESVISDRR